MASDDIGAPTRRGKPRSSARGARGARSRGRDRAASGVKRPPTTAGSAEPPPSETPAEKFWDNSARYQEASDDEEASDDGYDIEEISGRLDASVLDSEVTVADDDTANILETTFERTEKALQSLALYELLQLAPEEAGYDPDQETTNAEVATSSKTSGDTRQQSEPQPADAGKDAVQSDARVSASAQVDDFDSWLDSVGSQQKPVSTGPQDDIDDGDDDEFDSWLDSVGKKDRPR